MSHAYPPTHLTVAIVTDSDDDSTFILQRLRVYFNKQNTRVVAHRVQTMSDLLNVPAPYRVLLSDRARFTTIFTDPNSRKLLNKQPRLQVPFDV